MNVPRKNQIITVGRCVYEKGQHYLIEAFSKIKADDWTLVIVGDGPKRKELETQVLELGLTERVVFTGFQKNVDYYMSESKIFAFTSSSEGFPNALGEAMKAGLVPIAYDCVAGPSDLIEDQAHGFLVPLHQKELFKENLAKLMNSEILRKNLGDQAKIDMEKYTLEKIGNLYYNFIKEN